MSLSSREENFFVITNPLLWIWMLLIFLWIGIKWVVNSVGITDWWFVLFVLKKTSAAERTVLLNYWESKEGKFFYIKRKAWEKAIRIIKEKK